MLVKGHAHGNILGVGRNAFEKDQAGSLACLEWYRSVDMYRVELR